MTFRPAMAPIPAILLHTTLFSSSAAAAELFVDAAAGGGDGTVERPFATVQEAIDAADDGDDILVAGGTYAAVEVAGKEVHLLGGYDAGFEAVSPETPSIIEGTPERPAVTLFESGDSVLDGFVVRGGQRGVFIDADYLSTTNKPVVRNNVIEGNGTAALVGGGVFADHCDASFIGNVVRDNVGDRGSGIATVCNSVLLEDNVIEGNVSSGDHGGGLYLAGASLVVRGNVVRDNEVGVIAGYGWGAGVTVYGADVEAIFERNVFTRNHAQSLGSGAFIDDGATASFSGDLFFDNACGSEGGAALFVDGYEDIGTSVTLRNVTIASHACPDTMGNAVAVQTRSTVEIVDSIIWDNGGDDFATDDTSSISARYTLSQEAIDGEGNLGADPLFVDPTAGDFHVRSTRGRFDAETGEFVVDDVDSPTIDAGDPTADFAMEPGPNGLRVNLGHTGNTAEASMGGPGGEPPDEGGSSEEGGSGEDSGGDDTAPDASSGDESGSTDPAEEDAPPLGCACAHRRPTPWGAAWFLLAVVMLRRRRNHDSSCSLTRLRF